MTPAQNADKLIFFVNGRKIIEKNADPETMLLTYLRKKLRLTGTKYGCGGGGCGACTVMISRYDHLTHKIQHFSATACLLPICMLHGMAVTTVEGVGSTKTRIHPVQERIAKAHGSQCGFCTPGMVMSMYALLRNNPEPSIEELLDTLSGNLCRCTGYRPILDGYKTFCKVSCCQTKDGKCCLSAEDDATLSSDATEEAICTDLFHPAEFMPLDSTQEIIFPPELMLMAQQQQETKRVFKGTAITWISPANLEELLELKTEYPKAPLVVGNTNVGPDMKFKGVFHPVIISPTRVVELHAVTYTENGITIGAACSLEHVKNILQKATEELPEDQTKIFMALLEQIRRLGGQQIRNVASLGGSIASGYPNSDVNPVLVAGGCTVNLATKAGARQIPLDGDFFLGFCKTALKPEEVIISINIPYSSMWEFILAFRQAQRQENAFPIVNAAMSVVFKEKSNVIHSCRIVYGSVGVTTLSATRTCQELAGRSFDEEMLKAACTLVLDEISLPATAPGGMVEFRRTLIISFLFKFYLQILHKLQEMGLSSSVIPEEYSSAVEDLPRNMPKTLQMFQEVAAGQLSQDLVGRPIMHQSALIHATGEAVYCDDIPSLDGELALAMVTSTRMYAKIISIDKTEAVQMPGVHAVITADDVPGNNTRFLFDDEKLFAENEVTCVGQIVCAVAAETIAQAKAAARSVKITYEDLTPAILTIEDAVQQKSFLSPMSKLEKGNVDEAFKTADHIFQGQMHVGGQEHFYMETHSMSVIPKGENNEMDVFVSAQHPTLAQESVASALGVPANKIMCHVKRIGGAFGGKVTKASALASIAAVAAYKTGRAIRCVLERGDDMLITGARHPTLGKYRIGFMNDGRIIAADVTFFVNGGCSLDESDLVQKKMLLNMDNAYNIPNLRCSGFTCKTNLPSNTAFRGFGAPQGIAVTECWINDVAESSGLPPEMIREMNMYKGMTVTHYKQEFDSTQLLRCWNECLLKSSYHNQKIAIAEFNKQNRWKKRGIAIIPLKYGVGFDVGFLNQAAALVHIYKDGSVLVTHGGTEMGQGLHTKMMQIASRELRIPMSYIHISDTSTKSVPNTAPSAASFGTDSNGMAVREACQILLQRLDPIINDNPKGSWEDWVHEAYMNKISLSTTGFFRGEDAFVDWNKQEGNPYSYFSFGTACSVVEIDCLTGNHVNLRTDIVMDAGISLNPATDIGQIEGAFTQGLGHYTLEEMKFSPEGVLYTRGPAQYKIPATCDVPQEFNVYLLSGSKNPKAIYSSKGLGEPAVILGSSVFYAIKDAVAEARKVNNLTGPFIFNSPATPERIRMACEDQLTDQIIRDEPGTYIPWAISV
ncbi:aldehyde oxidase 1-like [Protopterus annectens]|uniref:aldehyde oxidase 1-like n=1 Tax=Protopterus annectens TaxID=7888 RepID=UPI001CFAF15D|nr:aldehyde oxidase 1-like [Protopterus annectens]